MIVVGVIVGLLIIGSIDSAVTPTKEEKKVEKSATETEKEPGKKKVEKSATETEKELGISRSNPIPPQTGGGWPPAMCSPDCWWTVSNVRKAPTIAIPFGEEAANGVFVLVDLKVENHSLNEQHTEGIGNSIRLFDSAGREYSLSNKAFYLDNPLTYETVSPGTSITRTAIFDVAIDATGLVLEVHGWGLSNSEARYISLGI